MEELQHADEGLQYFPFHSLAGLASFPSSGSGESCPVALEQVSPTGQSPVALNILFVILTLAYPLNIQLT